MLDNYSIIAWLEKNQIRTETGEPIDLRSHFYLYDIYKDMSPLLVCQKAAQVGFTTLAINKMLWLAKNNRMDIAYVMPTQSDITDFSGGKMNRIIAQNKVLQEYVKDRDTIEQKQVGDNMIYLRGTWTSRAALSFTADLVIVDEVDRCNLPIVDQYSSRLQHSKYKWQWYFSNPSFSGVGVDKYWGDSDQKHWFIQCKHCTGGQFGNGEQYMDFPDSFDFDTGEYICKYCAHPLSDEDRRVGRWVAKYKNKPYSGYWIPLFIVPAIPASYILDAHKNKPADIFDNFILGKPHAGSGVRPQANDVLQNVIEQVHPMTGRVVIGVDVGKTIHVIAGDENGLFYNSSSEDYGEVEALLKRFSNSVAVFDAGGDFIKPKELAEKYPGRIYFCYFGNDRKAQEIVRFGSGKERHTIIADRNRLIQLVVDEVTTKRVPMYGTQEDWNPLVEHFLNIYREDEENALGQPVRRWKRSGDDHLVLALAYWRAGMIKFSSNEKVKFVGGVTGMPKVERAIHIDPVTSTQKAITPKWRKPVKPYDWRNP